VTKRRYRVRFRRLRWIVFRAARPLVLALFRQILRLRIEGIENVSPAGGAVMVSNHLHNADPIILEAVFPRPVRFMAKQEIFRVPVISFIVRLTEAFPVDRGAPDRAALRAAQERLDDGAIIGLFPEGTRSATAALKAVYPGAAMIVTRSNVPVIPTAIFGTETLPFNGAKGRRRGKTRVTVRIGKPFRLPSRTAGGERIDLRRLTDLMMVEVAKLLPPEYRGIYADRVEDEAGMASGARGVVAYDERGEQTEGAASTRRP
jgi:1-acyl-sn-glycerol-3-phosphate acyltransferase